MLGCKRNWAVRHLPLGFPASALGYCKLQPSPSPFPTLSPLRPFALRRLFSCNNTMETAKDTKAFPSAANSTALALRFLDYVNKTGSPYHSATVIGEALRSHGFRELKETEDWGNLLPGVKYFVIRNLSSIIAFAIPLNVNDQQGFCAVATHTDSPCLRLRPNNNIKKEGCVQVGVECYGGGLWHTWLDRGLGIAGKVVVRKPTESGGSRLSEHLVRISRPLMILPNLAIHLQTSEERSAFRINTENHLQPILCSQVREELLCPLEEDDEKRRCVLPLLKLLSAELSCEPNQIVDMDMCLMDATPSRLCGIYEEFVESPRLDNLLSTWAAFQALIDMTELPGDGGCIPIAVAFDHEEVGSTSWTGADSNALEGWLRRICGGVGLEDKWYQMLAVSFLISADMAHAVHPNYADKHQKEHKVAIQKGVVLKENVNQRYASHAVTMAIIREMAISNGCAVQDFVVRNDSPCGSTVGPMLSSRLGLRCLDLGIPQWAMHSCRETCGVEDITHLYNLFKVFYRSFPDYDIARPL